MSEILPALNPQTPQICGDRQPEGGHLSDSECTLVRYRVLALVSHVIQYQMPMFRALAADPRLDLTVALCSDWGLSAYHDEGFGCDVRWDVPLLGGFRSEFLPNWSPRPSPTRFWGLLNPGVINRIRREFDAVWVHGWSHATYWIAMLTAFTAGVPVLLRGESNLLPHLPKWKGLLKPAVLGPLFRRISAFLAIGRNNAEFYRAYGVASDRIFAVPYSVDNDFFLSNAQTLPPKPELKRDLHLPEDLPVVLFCGKLTPVKRPMDLLRAFEQFVRSRPAVLVYVGDGELRGGLEAYASSQGIANVHFAGFKNQKELPRYFGGADVLVLPSGIEPWGLVINEAMNFGLPVICSNQVGCAADLVRPGENGYIFPAGDIQALADCLLAVLSDGEKRESMGRRSRELVAEWGFGADAEGVVAALQFVSMRTALSARG